jgi:hypothetical protein
VQSDGGVAVLAQVAQLSPEAGASFTQPMNAAQQAALPSMQASQAGTPVGIWPEHEGAPEELEVEELDELELDVPPPGQARG